MLLIINMNLLYHYHNKLNSIFRRDDVTNLSELEAFKFFLANFDKICRNIESIKVRLQPTQNVNSIIQKFKEIDHRIEVSEEKNSLKINLTPNTLLAVKPTL